MNSWICINSLIIPTIHFHVCRVLVPASWEISPFLVFTSQRMLTWNQSLLMKTAIILRHHSWWPVLLQVKNNIQESLVLKHLSYKSILFYKSSIFCFQGWNLSKGINFMIHSITIGIKGDWYNQHALSDFHKCFLELDSSGIRKFKGHLWVIFDIITECIVITANMKMFLSMAAVLINSAEWLKFIYWCCCLNCPTSVVENDR